MTGEKPEPGAAALKLAGPHRPSCPQANNSAWACQCPRKQRALAIDASLAQAWLAQRKV